MLALLMAVGGAVAAVARVGPVGTSSPVSAAADALPTGAATAGSVPNLLTNGSFEGAGSSPGPTPGWKTVSGAVAALEAPGVDGAYVADFVQSAAGGSVLQDVAVKANVGHTFNATVWLATATGNSKVAVALSGNNGKTGLKKVTVTATPTWRQVSVALTVRATTSTVRLQIYGVTGQHIEVDNATLTQQFLRNGSFDSPASGTRNTTHWTKTQAMSAAYKSGRAIDGSRFADLVVKKKGGNIYQEVALTGSVGQTLQATIWLRAASGHRAVAVGLSGNNGKTGKTTKHVTVGTTWTQVTVKLPLRGKTTTARLRIYGPVKQHLWMDGAFLTLVGPPPATSPQPVSTSRYLRDLKGAATDLTVMRNRGVTDAANNPTGHSYLMLLAAGGQDHARGGVVLTATTKFITYANLVAAVNAYVDGYASRMLPGAPAVIAVGTNNDMDVSATTGVEWANLVVKPIASHAARYSGIGIAGADDMEPGFRGGVSATRSWLTGYLGATKAPFVFFGSADGCSWTASGGACNNGWKASDLYWLGAGAAPSRIIALPQVYNATMANQWRYISITGTVARKPRINFGGELTEYTACRQAGSCASMGGNAAWKSLWAAIRTDSRTSQSAMPYSTDLRIN
ncbi:MAG: hypothetical protein FWD74_01720 [Actinomycetia bacterium]|nr:hypothetical protein [Actinomycetes bacterium]